MFEFTVYNIFKVGKNVFICGKANEPLFSGKISNGSKTLEIEAVYGNTTDNLEKLSFLVKSGFADKSDVGQKYLAV